MKEFREAAIDLMFRAVLGGYRADESQIEDAIRVLHGNGFAIVPIKPNERMLDELAHIGDGPMISGAEVWGYMLAAAEAFPEPGEDKP